jgi:hypothetical protein
MAYNEAYYAEKKAKLDKQYEEIKNQFVQQSMELAAWLQEKLTELKAERVALEQRIEESKANSNGNGSANNSTT